MRCKREEGGGGGADRDWERRAGSGVDEKKGVGFAARYFSSIQIVLEADGSRKTGRGGGASLRAKKEKGKKKTEEGKKRHVERPEFEVL